MGNKPNRKSESSSNSKESWHSRNKQWVREYRALYRARPEVKIARAALARASYAKRKKSIVVQQQEYGSRPEKRALLIIAKARRNAARKRVPFSLQAKDIVPALLRGTCEVTGLPFAMQLGRGRQPLAPSIDRKVPSLGYVQSNVRMVVWAFNAACGDWGEEVLWQIVAARWPDRIKEDLCRQTNQ